MKTHYHNTRRSSKRDTDTIIHKTEKRMTDNDDSRLAKKPRHRLFTLRRTSSQTPPDVVTSGDDPKDDQAPPSASNTNEVETSPPILVQEMQKCGSPPVRRGLALYAYSSEHVGESTHEISNRETPEDSVEETEDDNDAGFVQDQPECSEYEDDGIVDSSEFEDDGVNEEDSIVGSKAKAKEGEIAGAPDTPAGVAGSQQHTPKPSESVPSVKKGPSITSDLIDAGNILTRLGTKAGQLKVDQDVASANENDTDGNEVETKTKKRTQNSLDSSTVDAADTASAGMQQPVRYIISVEEYEKYARQQTSQYIAVDPNQNVDNGTGMQVKPYYLVPLVPVDSPQPACRCVCGCGAANHPQNNTASPLKRTNFEDPPVAHNPVPTNAAGAVSIGIQQGARVQPLSSFNPPAAAGVHPPSAFYPSAAGMVQSHPVAAKMPAAAGVHPPSAFYPSAAGMVQSLSPFNHPLAAKVQPPVPLNRPASAWVTPADIPHAPAATAAALKPPAKKLPIRKLHVGKKFLIKKTPATNGSRPTLYSPVALPSGYPWLYALPPPYPPQCLFCHSGYFPILNDQRYYAGTVLPPPPNYYVGNIAPIPQKYYTPTPPMPQVLSNEPDLRQPPHNGDASNPVAEQVEKLIETFNTAGESGSLPNAIPPVVLRGLMQAITTKPKSAVASKFKRWTKEEDEKLLRACEGIPGDKEHNWCQIAVDVFGGKRNAVQCKSRWQNMIRPGRKVGRWTKEEDATIIQMMQEGKSFAEIAEALPDRRLNQIRERWMTSLDPSNNYGPWTAEEMRILLETRERIGNKWLEIARLLPGRSVPAVKNRYYNIQTSKQREGRRMAVETLLKWDWQKRKATFNKRGDSPSHSNQSYPVNTTAETTLSAESTQMGGYGMVPVDDESDHQVASKSGPQDEESVNTGVSSSGMVPF